MPDAPRTPPYLAVVTGAPPPGPGERRAARRAPPAPPPLPDVSAFVLVDPQEPLVHSQISPNYLSLVNGTEDRVPVEALARFGDALLALVTAVEEAPTVTREDARFWTHLAVLLGGITNAVDRPIQYGSGWPRLVALLTLVDLERVLAGLHLPDIEPGSPRSAAMAAYLEAWEDFEDLVRLVVPAGTDTATLLAGQIEAYYRAHASVRPQAAMALHLIARVVVNRFPNAVGGQPSLAVYRNAMFGVPPGRQDVATQLLSELRGEVPVRAAIPLPPQPESGWGPMRRWLGLDRRDDRVPVVRIGVIGPSGAGKTALKRVLTESQSILDLGVAVNWNREPKRVRVGPTAEAVVLATGVTHLHAHGEVRVELIDTAGVEAERDTPDANYLAQVGVLDLLVLAVPPEAAWDPEVDSRLIGLANAAARVLRNRPVASVVLCYTMLDEVGLLPSSLGRMVTPRNAPALGRIQAELAAGKVQGFPARITRALGLDARIPYEPDREVVAEMVTRTADLWKNVLLSPAVRPPWSFNAYLTIAQPGVPGARLRPGLGAELILADFFGRVHQPSWPFWQGANRG